MRASPGPSGLARSFGPLRGPAPRVLILGSLPGAASLAAGEYYAHPRNLFWDFMGELFGASRDLPYPVRIARLQAARVAVWDVVQEARRPGSLDASIELATARHNDILALLHAEPSLCAVAFNGATAERLFRQRIGPSLADLPRPLAYLRLPSTSPAHAALSRTAKLGQWRQLIPYCGNSGG